MIIVPPINPMPLPFIMWFAFVGTQIRGMILDLREMNRIRRRIRDMDDMIKRMRDKYGR